MANLKASIKDIRKTIKRQALNNYQRSRLRTLAKKIHHLAENGELDQARVTLNEYTVYLDRAGRKHLIHPKNADRKKSRMVKYLNKIKPDVEAAPEATEAPETAVQEDDTATKTE